MAQHPLQTVEIVAGVAVVVGATFLTGGLVEAVGPLIVDQPEPWQLQVATGCLGLLTGFGLESDIVQAPTWLVHAWHAFEGLEVSADAVSDVVEHR